MYVCQLFDGKMLLYKDGKIGVSTTGYPLPECSIKIGDKVLKGWQKVLEALISYIPEDMFVFINECMQMNEPVPYKKFKYKVWAENIGGGCPQRFQRVGQSVLEGYSEKEAFLLSLVPWNNIDELFADDFIDTHKDLVYKNWHIKSNYKSGLYNTPLLMYYNIKNYNLDIADFLKDCVLRCSTRFNYMTEIIAPSGVACLVFAGDISNDEDFSYFYEYISGANMAFGFCDVELDEDTVEIQFNYTDKVAFSWGNFPRVFKGTYDRVDLSQELDLEE